jgi:hypothetical protein
VAKYLILLGYATKSDLLGSTWEAGSARVAQVAKAAAPGPQSHHPGGRPRTPWGSAAGQVKPTTASSLRGPR